MRLLDVVIAYAYGSVNSEVYVRILKGSKNVEACPRKTFNT